MPEKQVDRHTKHKQEGGKSSTARVARQRPDSEYKQNCTLCTQHRFGQGEVKDGHHTGGWGGKA